MRLALTGMILRRWRDIMPELPEVETICRSLEAKICDCQINRVEVFLDKTIRTPDVESFINILEGQKITGIGRHGKYLLIKIGDSQMLVIHLRMTGRLIFADPDITRDQHTHVVFQLDNGGELRFHDLRKFGTMDLLTLEGMKVFPPLCFLGPDALDPKLTEDVFKKKLEKRRGQIKNLLLNQSFVTGIGNIYANEILWKAGIHPKRPAGSLSSREQGELYHAMREVLTLAIDNHGTTLRDYVDGEGNPGRFQDMLAVHRKEGAPCPCCGKPIVRAKLSGRSVYYCATCQK